MSYLENPSECLPVSTASSSASTDPIFILGISQRSGTNFLFDLLRLHPDCGAPSINWEDFLLHKADFLFKYVNSVYEGWRRRGAGQEIEDLLYEQLGNGLISVLASRVKEKRVVTKTPSVQNLNYFFKLFPRAYLLILVRDGRAVVESRVKTFSESYESAMRIWAEGADEILRFNQRVERSDFRCLIVKYEVLWNNLNEELRRVFAFLGLDADKYDFDAAANLPVRGSSVFHGEGEKAVHWKPVEKTPQFNPVGRSQWTRSVHERFKWLAGQQQVKLGYEENRNEGDQWSWVIWNEVMDIRWQIIETYRALVSLIKIVLKWIFGADAISKARRVLLGFRRESLR
jgi:hypothetical protein